MLRSIYARMLVTYILITFFILLFQSVILIQLLRSSYVDTASVVAVEQAEQLSREVSDHYRRSHMSIKTLVDVLKKKNSEESSIWLIDENSLIIDVSQNDKLYYNKEAITQAIESAFAGQNVIFEDTFNISIYDTTISISTPLYIEGSVEYALLVHTPIDAAKGINYEFYKYTLLAGFIAIVICMILISISSKHISYPINQLSKMCIGISNGNYSVKIKTSGEDEIGQLAESFNVMASQLKRNDELRTNFVANVSHELRSPITSIHGFAQGMQDGTIKEDEYDKYLGIILDETNRLKKLVTELLDLSQIDSGEFPLHFRKFDINELIRRVIIKYIDRMEEKNIQVEVDFEEEFAFVYADSDRINQVLVNLLDNAIKFTLYNGTIKLSTKRVIEKIWVSVTDTGQGIVEEELSNVFERFYKSDKAHSEKNGTGLGLSIVKKILNEHGEKISVSSEFGKGTTFVFTLTIVDI